MHTERQKKTKKAEKRDKLQEGASECEEAQCTSSITITKKTRWKRKIMSIVALAATYNLHQVLPLRAILGELLQPVAVISIIYKKRYKLCPLFH